ncbi:MAG TPA: alpha/beta hydrolase [Tepidisphaeraceae bacterium]
MRIALAVYLGATLVLSMFQEWLIFPGQSTQGRRDAIVPPMRNSDLVQLDTSHGDRITILFGKAMTAEGQIREDSSTRPSIIFFYGNAMSLADAVGFCLEWRKLGANVVGVEYPGYGMSTGKPGEQAFYAAGDAAYEYLLARGDINKTKIIPTGLSIGTGVAVDLASRKPVGGLALFAAYTSLDDLARHNFAWLPTSKILRHHFNNEKKIAGLRIPILIVHGRHDSIIPVWMSERLEKAATQAQVTRILVDTDHNDLFELAGDELNAAMSKLIEQVGAAPSPSPGTPGEGWGGGASRGAQPPPSPSPGVPGEGK